MKTTIKKTVSRLLFPLLIVVGFFAFSGNVHAQYAPLQVMNATQTPNCNFSQCGASSVSAKPGDFISVQIFYNNTGQASQNVSLSLSPRTQGPSTNFTVTGGPNNIGGGSVNISLTSGNPQTMTAVANTARWYKDRTTNPINVPIDSLFNGSFNVGALQGGASYGGVSPNQGVLVVDFQISHDVPTPVTYACNDGVDNDGDGLVDTQDPGCVSSSDNDEYNVVQTIRYQCNDGVDNDSDGYVDMQDPGCSSSTDNDESPYHGYTNQNQYYRYGCTDPRASNYDSSANQSNNSCQYNYNNNYNYNQNQGTAPTALTTVGTGLSQNSAQINGIAYANNATTNTWFEWGVTRALGNATPSQSIGNSQGSAIQSTLYNLQPGTIYFFRAVAQNSYGISRGDIMLFRTLPITQVAGTEETVRTETKIVYVRDTVAQTNLSATLKVPSLLALKLEEMSTTACVGNGLSYTLTYQNVSKKTVSNTVAQVVFPNEIVFDRASAGSYDADTRTLTIPLGTLLPGQSGQVMIMARVAGKADSNMIVTTAKMVYTNPDTTAQEDVIAYVIHRTDSCGTNNLGAAALFGYGFFPSTLFGWILLIVAILLLIMLARTINNRIRRTVAPSAPVPPTELPR